jgi:hypothetical protein
MEMEITRALKLRDQAVSSLRDLYSLAASCGLSSSQINEEYSHILERLAKAPGWVRAYLDGYRAALTEEAYRNKLVYGTFINGQFYSTHRNREDYYEKQGLSPQIFSEEHDRSKACGHYWADSLKPFFVA